MYVLFGDDYLLVLAVLHSI